MKYVIRFSDCKEIKTLVASDLETYKYIIKQLDNEEKEYVVIKVNFLNHNEFTMKSLLDYEVK